MIDQSSKPTLRRLIEDIVDEKLAGRAALGPQPGTLVSFDEDTQLAVVQPGIMSVRTGIAGEEIRRPRPQISDVPLLFWGGKKGRITGPVEPGDIVLLVFCGAHMDRWLLGTGTTPVDPGFVDPENNIGRIADCVAISGLSNAAPATSAPDDALVVHADAIKLGGPDASELAAWNSAIVLLKNVFTNWSPVPADGGAALKALLTTLINTGWPQGASKTRIE